MTDLRDFERRLVPLRTIAGCDEAWAKYRDRELPETQPEHSQAHQHAGFDAGYAAAMERVRVLLGELQTEALRAVKP